MAFGTITVHAGNFKKGTDSQFLNHNLLMKIDGKFSREKISIRRIVHLEVASEENASSFLGSAGMGILGGVLLGGVGALAGVVTGGKRKDVTFICTFDDGRKFLGTAPSDIFTKLQAALFDRQLASDNPPIPPQPGSSSPSFLLIIGIFFLPFIFAWFTLNEKYSKSSKIISFIWLAFIVFSVLTDKK